MSILDNLTLNKAIVGTAQALGHAAEVRNKLEKLIYSLNKNTFDVAECLAEIKNQGYYNQWGFNSFSEYVKDLDIKKSKAHYLTRIVDVMDEVGIVRDQYEPLGIGKLREICSLNPKDTYVNPQTQEKTPMSEFIKGFVEKGTEMELTEIRDHVRTLKGLVGENDLVWLNFQVLKQALDNIIKPALEMAKHAAGTVGYSEGEAVDISDAAALEYIAVEFLNNPSNEFLANQSKKLNELDQEKSE